MWLVGKGAALEAGGREEQVLLGMPRPYRAGGAVGGGAGDGTKDGRRVLVDRLWPRGIKKEEAHIDEWLKEVSPSDELRKWFAHDPEKWADFKKCYASEIREHSDLLNRLRTEAAEGTITLLYSAKDEEHNNAVALRELLMKGKERGRF